MIIKNISRCVCYIIFIFISSTQANAQEQILVDSAQGVGLRITNGFSEGVVSTTNLSDGFYSAFNFKHGFHAFSNIGYGFYSKNNTPFGYYATENNYGFVAEDNLIEGFEASKNDGDGFISRQNGNHGYVSTVNQLEGFYADANEGWGFYAVDNVQGAAYLSGKVYMGNLVGIGTISPGCRLHIKQLGQGLNNGLRLQRSDNTNYWNTHINSLNDLVFWYNGTTSPGGGIRAWIQNEDATYHSSSDGRLKQDIISLEPALDKILKLNPVSYRFKSSPNATMPSLGFIAQEVEGVYPELVSENDGMKGLNYAAFSVVAIKAIQEQQATIEFLATKLKKLNKEINSLKSAN